jgi:hypothetical protein
VLLPWLACIFGAIGIGAVLDMRPPYAIFLMPLFLIGLSGTMIAYGVWQKTYFRWGWKTPKGDWGSRRG